MAKSISTIVTDVKVCMDEIADNDAEFEGTQDDEELAKIIKSKIQEALRFVYANADYSLLDPSQIETSSTNSTISGTNIYKQVVSLPSNFLRLVYAKSASWVGFIGQEDLIMWNDKEYAMLSDPYCTGTPERPKGALTWCTSGANAGKKQLELYCLNGNGGVSVGIMTEPSDASSYTSSQTIDIPAKVYRAVIYYISGLVYTTYADAQKASMMFDQANDIIGFSQQAAVQQPPMQTIQ